MIEKLSLDEKNVIILRFYNSCTIQEVADILNIPLGTAKTILYRALKKLQKEWKGDDVCEQ
ncbi:sigma-70 family RNA polymerase sigma factor [Geobacillus stearothermophilus]|nr:sigma-70 family RNA polymerase sigma factor [Geobacillus stearothermophilus]